jgi:hypothetical protein
VLVSCERSEASFDVLPAAPSPDTAIELIDQIVVQCYAQTHVINGIEIA